MSSRRSANLVAILLCLLFVGIGALWISEPGIQTDEALFAAGIYPPTSGQNIVRIFHHDLPLMVMSYVGAVKSWIWTPIFVFWPPSPASVRIPALLIGALTIWLFYRLLLRTLGVRAALTGCALLATDTMFLMTTRLDWGPVAIQHLCLTGSILSFVAFHQEGRRLWLRIAFLILGLGVWDKALFFWSLAGLFAGGCGVFWREIRMAMCRRNVAVAGVAFLVGASPLVIFNTRHKFVTFRSNTAFSTEIFAYKLGLLKATWEGHGLLGAIPRDEWDGPERSPDSAPKRVLFEWNKVAGRPRRNLFTAALVISGMLLPFIWQTPARKAAMFALVFCAVTFLVMALTKNAGTGAHHTILLWPVPHLFIAAVLAEISCSRRFGRIGLGMAVSALCLSNLLVTSTFYANMLRNGSTAGWSDAIYRLSDAIKSIQPNRVCVVDWGFFDNLRLLHHGRLTLCVANEPANEEERQSARDRLEEGDNVFVAHTEALEINTGARQSFMKFLESEGYRKIDSKIFCDSNGRPTIELFRVEKRTAN